MVCLDRRREVIALMYRNYMHWQKNVYRLMMNRVSRQMVDGPSVVSDVFPLRTTLLAPAEVI
jgi:hypothetical protein